MCRGGGSDCAGQVYSFKKRFYTLSLSRLFLLSLFPYFRHFFKRSRLLSLLSYFHLSFSGSPDKDLQLRKLPRFLQFYFNLIKYSLSQRWRKDIEIETCYHSDQKTINPITTSCAHLGGMGLLVCVLSQLRKRNQRKGLSFFNHPSDICSPVLHIFVKTSFRYFLKYPPDIHPNLIIFREWLLFKHNLIFIQGSKLPINNRRGDNPRGTLAKSLRRM